MEDPGTEGPTENQSESQDVKSSAGGKPISTISDLDGRSSGGKVDLPKAIHETQNSVLKAKLAKARGSAKPPEAEELKRGNLSPNRFKSQLASPKMKELPNDLVIKQTPEPRKSKLPAMSTKATLERLDQELVDDLSETTTPLQFIFNSLNQAFDMGNAQVLSLLADDAKYLYQIAIKGLKNSEYDKVKQWYQISAQNAHHLATLLNNEISSSSQQRVLFKTLNIFKCGFYSEDSEVARLTTEFFMTLMVEVNEAGGEIVGETWEWLVRPTPTIQEVTPVKRLGTRKF